MVGMFGFMEIIGDLILHEELLNFFVEYDLNDFTNLIGDFNNDGILNDQDLNILIDSIISSSDFK